MKKEISDRTVLLYQKEQYIRIDIPAEKKKKEKWTRNLFKQIVDKKFPKLWKELDPWIQEANRTTSYLNQKGLRKGTFY